MDDHSQPIAPTKPNPIKLEQLNSVPAISALGLVAARMLQQHGIVTLMISAEGVVEVVPEGELELDTYEITDALALLANRGYTDDQMESYLKQRDCRFERDRLKRAGA